MSKLKEKKDKSKVDKNNTKNSTINKITDFFDIFGKGLKKKKKKVKILTVATIVIFILSLVGVICSLKSFFYRQESIIVKYDDDSKKFVQVANGFVVEAMSLESGDELPTIEKYFSEEIEIQEDATILYYRNDELLSLEEFTIENEGVLYVIGTGEVVVVINNGEEYRILMTIRDTTSPVVSLRDVSITEGDTLDLNSFVEIYADNSYNEMYNIALEQEVDYSAPGDYELNLKICDFSDNCINQITKLTVNKKETQKPNNDKPNNNTKPGGNGGNNSTGGNSSNSDNSGNGNTGNNNSNPGGNTGNNGNSGSGDNNDNKKPDNNPNTPNKPSAEELALYKKIMNVYEETYSASPSSLSLSSIHRSFKDAVGKYRSDLVLDDTLCHVARLRLVEISRIQKGNAMKDINGNLYNNHVRPDGSKFQTFTQEFDYVYNTNNYSLYLGEVYSANQDSIEDAVNAFYNSAGHKAILMDMNFKRYGVAKYLYGNSIFYLIIFAK